MIQKLILPVLCCTIAASNALNFFDSKTQALPLAPGEVVFTDPKSYVINMPDTNGRDYVIYNFTAEVVDERNQSVPLSEVYNHHWLLYSHGQDRTGKYSLDPDICGGKSLSYMFGVGAESRNTITQVPKPYGVVVKANTVFTGNIHLLRTENLVDNDVQSCIECAYHPSKPCRQQQSGSFACCGQGSYCPTVPGSTKEKKNYYLKIQMTWDYVQPDTIPAYVLVLDASSTGPYGESCRVEYNIGNQGDLPAVLKKDFIMKFDGYILYAVGHQHIGGENITLSLRRKGSSESQMLCASNAVYGDGTSPGNEKGYLVKITDCTFGLGEEIQVSKGDVLTINSIYRDEKHGGVMSLFYIVASTRKYRRAIGVVNGDQKLMG